MPDERVRARRMTARKSAMLKTTRLIPAEERPIPADSEEQRENLMKRWYRAPRKPAMRPLPIQVSLDWIANAAKRRAEYLKVYKQSGEKDLDAYTAFWAESEQIAIAREHIRFFINYMINLAGPGITDRSASLRVGVSRKRHDASMRKWKKERVDSGRSPLKPFTESYYNYYGYSNEN